MAGIQTVEKMILTVTLNPLLEKRYFFKDVELGKSHRCFKEELSAGGKGINISRQLNLLGMKNSAYTFLGGNNGKLLRSLLTHEQIEFSSVSTRSETRTADLIIEENNHRITTFFGVNSPITKEESDQFKEKLDKMIQNCSIAAFSGSSPCKETDDIFPYAIDLANKHDKISILDTYGPHLSHCIDALPTVVHNNVSEVEESLGINLKSENEKVDYLDHLYKKGIKLAFLTDGPNPFYASKYDFHYRIIPPYVNEVDSTGSGDAFTAGLVYGLENSIVFDEFVKIAAALGAANASMLDTCSVSKEMLDTFRSEIKIEPIGKRMKLIDDSPTTH